MSAQVLKLLELPAADMAVFTSSPVEARIHVGFMGKDLLPESLIDKIKDGPWTHVVAFRPTGEAPEPTVARRALSQSSHSVCCDLACQHRAGHMSHLFV